MPLKKASGKGKKATQAAISYNISELTRTNRSKAPDKKRSRAQISAISYSAAKRKKK